ncbi:MAG TPA: DUF4157 domain-containing protein [Longimicrobium sp.]|jgi:hypothetical protein
MRVFTQKQNQPGPRDSSSPARSSAPSAGPPLHADHALAGQRTPGARYLERLAWGLAGAAAPPAGPGRAAVHDDGPAVREAAEQGIAGGGGPLPYLAAIQRSFGRHDVGHVRAHQGSRAAAAARAIGARAYATGDQVAFAGAPDLRTAAHEAAHVVQQRAGVQLAGGVGRAGDPYERHADAVADLVAGGRSAEGLLDRMAPAGSRALAVQRRVVQRAPIATDFGEFDTTKYDAVGPAGSEYGVDIELTFDPDRTKVDAKKIGLTQALSSKLGGVDAAIHPTITKRMAPSGAGKGWYIDRSTSGAYGNPLYAAGVPGAKDKLRDTPTVAGWGQHGWNYTDASGTLQHQTAILKDTAQRPGRGNDSGQTFETAALAVEGAQSGTYMGSVSWGWSVDGTGTYSKLPLTLVSKGKPSRKFRAAARQWNTTRTAGTIKTRADPTDVYDAAYSVAFTVARGTEVQVTGATIHNNEVYSEVTINTGPQAGQSGNIKTTDLRDAGGGNRVIKLPIP